MSPELDWRYKILNREFNPKKEINADFYNSIRLKIVEYHMKVTTLHNLLAVISLEIKNMYNISLINLFPPIDIDIFLNMDKYKVLQRSSLIK